MLARNAKAEAEKNKPPRSSRTLFRLPDDINENYIELGTHGDRYVPIQNKEVFELAYALGDDVKVESAGSLFNGKKLFVLLRGNSIDVAGKDQVDPYLGLFNSHDGSLSLSAMPTSVRIVCNNTLTMALREGKSKMFRVMHTESKDARIKAMKNALESFKQTREFFAATANTLAGREIKMRQDLMTFWSHAYTKLVPQRKDEPDELYIPASLETIQTWEAEMEIEKMTLGYESSNWWLAANAVTKWVQHEEPSRLTAGWKDRQQWSSLVGSRQDDSVEVFKMALAM